ncbi:MAG: EAL domain-containing protein [Burkholderiaceae bacterium]
MNVTGQEPAHSSDRLHKEVSHESHDNGTVAPFELLAGSAAVGVIAVASGGIERVSVAAARIFDSPAEALVGQRFETLFASVDGMRVFGDRVAALVERQAPVSLEWRARRADGALFWCRFLLLTELESNGAMLWLVEDITVRKEAELEQAQAQEELELQMHEVRHELMWSNERLVAELYERSEAEEQGRRNQLYDALTQLPNRQLLEKRLDEAIRNHQDGGDLLAVLVLDFDGFTAVNEAIGQRAADAILGQAAQRLLMGVRASDLVARSGADEFAVVLGHLREGDDVLRVAHKLIEGLAEPYRIDGQEVVLTATAGAVLFPDDGAQAELLLRNAEAALAYAKRRGRGVVQGFETHMSAGALRRVRIEAALRRAIEDKQFLVHYQARIDLTSRQIVGAEALVRWQHPELGLVEPAEFIGVAEDTGLIAPIGEIVLNEACAQAMRWQAEGRGDIAISVNLSPREFRGRDLLALVQQALKASGLPAFRLAIEITEASFLRDPEAAARAISGLRALGVQLVLDDFGTGQSSLAWLRRFPIDAIKVDGEFVRAAIDNEIDSKIVQAIAGLGHGLGLRVIAEGVESSAQLDHARQCGCDEAQGYWIGRPVTGDQLWAEQA